MKNIKNILTIPIMCCIFIACVEDEKIRYELDDFEKAVNMRIVTDVSSFDATNEEASTTLTFYSENSEDVQEVELFLDHYIFLEDRTSQRVSLTIIPGSDITNDGTTEFTITLAEMAEALGITQGDLAGGDIMTIYNVTTMKNGKVFPDTVLTGTDFENVNITPNILQSSSTTSFTATLTYPIVCQLQGGFGTGNYRFEVIEGANTGFGVPVFDNNVTVNISATSNTGRTFNVGYFTAFGFDTDVAFDFACNITLVPTTAAGLGCGGNGLSWAIDTSNPGTFNIDDDTEFTISILHNVLNDCGLPVGERYTFRLTKQ